jgi:DNA-binding NarL/FixJ family response regulator
VLLVEDDDAMRHALFVAIRNRFGVPVFLADSVEAGRQTIEKLHDRLLLAILDVKLADGSGLDLLPVLRAVECPALPVVLTAYASEEVAHTVVEHGVVRYLHKSCSIDELYGALAPLVEIALKRREDLARPPPGEKDAQGLASQELTSTEPMANGSKPLAPGAWIHLSREQRLDWICANYGILPEERIAMEKAGSGLTNAEIAEQTGWSVHNVKYHLSKVFEKLHVKSRHQIEWMLS